MIVQTSLEPPGLADLDDGDDGEPTGYVHVNLVEPDGTYRTASTLLPAAATDEHIAEQLVACVRGVAAMRGPGLVAAIESRIR